MPIFKDEIAPLGAYADQYWCYAIYSDNGYFDDCKCPHDIRLMIEQGLLRGTGCRVADTPYLLRYKGETEPIYILYDCVCSYACTDRHVLDVVRNKHTTTKKELDEILKHRHIQADILINL